MSKQKQEVSLHFNAMIGHMDLYSSMCEKRKTFFTFRRSDYSAMMKFMLEKEQQLERFNLGADHHQS